MATEKLKFKIELYATMWNSPPHAEVLINNISCFKGDITSLEKEPTIIEFEQEFEEGKDYNLIIKRSGKHNSHTVVNEKGDILKDQLLHIKNIEIDEIDIGALVYQGVYTPEYPQPWATQQKEDGNELPRSFKSVTRMGHNGEWKLGFASPFYMWLLENLY
jgi:hypothetical protein|tara:strand:- start:202 stop:684 length:483 start_codon:yes stop_codon:yes gene_type:complete